MGTPFSRSTTRMPSIARCNAQLLPYDVCVALEDSYRLVDRLLHSALAMPNDTLSRFHPFQRNQIRDPTARSPKSAVILAYGPATGASSSWCSSPHRRNPFHSAQSVPPLPALLAAPCSTPFHTSQSLQRETRSSAKRVPTVVPCALARCLSSVSVSLLVACDCRPVVVVSYQPRLSSKECSRPGILEQGITCVSSLERRERWMDGADTYPVQLGRPG
jgi:hypothetical protein